MKSIHRIITASIVSILIPFAIAAGQEMKNEQRIKIVIAEDDGSKVVIDTLITGNTESDSIVVKNGHTIYLAKEGRGIEKVNCESLVNEKSYSYTIETDRRDADSEKTKYVISRDGILITVEGSDYTKVKEIIKDIEKALDTQNREN